MVRTASTRIVAGAAALLALLGACSTKKTEPKQPAGPSLSIASPATGTSVKGNVVSLDMTVGGVTIVKADGDTSGKTGHFHVFIDREPLAAGQTIPKEAGIVHSADDPIKLTGLAVGEHALTVVLGDGTHARIGNASAKVTVKVEGPSVDASAPATGTAGQPVVVDVKVEGVTLFAADGDTSGATGHLHLFVDRDPILTGPIPKEAGIIHTKDLKVPVPDLAAGDHTIWVVLGDGTHTAFDPPVLDKVTVTVA